MVVDSQIIFLEEKRLPVLATDPWFCLGGIFEQFEDLERRSSRSYGLLQDEYPSIITLSIGINEVLERRSSLRTYD